MSATIRLIFSGLLTLFMVALFTFALMKCVPGGPFEGDKALPPEVMAALKAKFRLDEPAPKQFYFYLRDLVFNFDMGPSIKYPDRKVEEIISESLPVSLELGAYALLIAIISGSILGIFAATQRGKLGDTISMGIAVLGISLPSFLVGALMILIFSQYLGLLPAAMWDGPEYKILPSIVLGLRPTAIIARMLRSSILEVLGLDFVRTARSKGLSETKVLLVHVLKNSLLPLITILGPLAATVLTGSFIVEYIFSVPGLAAHFVSAVSNRDYPLIMGVTLLYAAFLVVANLFVDVMYGLVDPRVKAP